MAIKAVWMGPEATEGTLAATLFFMRVESWLPIGDAKLDIPQETTNSTIVDQNPVPGARQGNWTAKVRAYFDLSVHWFAMTLGLPTITVAPGGSTGTFDHTFKPGGIAPLPYSVVWKQLGSAGTLYRQMTGCKGKTIKATLMNTGGLVFEIQGHGRYPVASTTQSATDTTAAYNQPMGMAQQAISLNGSGWLKPKKFDVAIDTGIAPDWNISATRDYTRMKIGVAKGTADAQAFFDTYASTSIIFAQDSASQLLAGGVILTVTDPLTSIGSGTTSNPNMVWTLPKPYVQGATEDATNTDPEEKGKITLAYDGGTASNMSIKFHNQLAGTGVAGPGSYTGS